ncbi:MAG TPA: AAA family ATPase [Chloroflexota bacterium]|nr:AAA family ATPase [Chloroflexota bacterium]
MVVPKGTAGFAELLQRYRVAAGITQEELAEKARLSARAISDLERGVKVRPHVATVRQLADALQLSETEKEEFQLAARPNLAGRHPPAERATPGVRTFLFADLRGYTQFTQEHGDEAAARLVAVFSRVVGEGVAAWDGDVIEYQGDRVLAVFQSARQALRASLDIQERLRLLPEEMLPLGVGIGLDAGEAVVSEVSGFRGAALNLAARLCDQAKPGEVLSSEGVIHLAGSLDGIGYVEQAPLRLKGFTNPVTAVLVVPALGGDESPVGGDIPQVLPVGGFLGSLPSGPLVAHDEEVAMLRAAVELVAAGGGRLVLIAGEAGIGKTRLAQEVTWIAHEEQFVVAAGRCYEPQQSIPYYPFLEALSTAVTASPAVVRGQAAHRWPYLARLLPDQFGSVPDSAPSAVEEQDRLFRAVAGFVQAISEARPIVILLDDLHWSDSASLQLLHYLARQTRGSRVLLVGTYRDVEVSPDHPLEATLRDLAREQLMERVMLKRLRQTEIAELITGTVGTVEEVPEFAELVYRHTDGNPFFTQQIVQVLIDDGTLYREGGQWKRRAIREIDVPESVRSVIAQRVSRLDAEAREILQEASVLGPAFHFDDLLAMKLATEGEHDVEDAVDEALTSASTLGLVRETGRDEYAFDHALTQQALYSSLSPRRRRRVHLAAGEALDGLPERRRNQRAAELAWHFLQGDDPQRAARYSLLAGDQAESVFAHDEAERHYRTALELAQDLDDRLLEAEAVEKLGVVLRTVGRYDEALGLLERAAALYSKSGDLEGEGRTVAQIGILCSVSGTAEQGIGRLQPLVAKLEQRAPSRSLALLYAALVHLYNFVGRQNDQLNATERLLELARDLRDDRLLAEAEVHRGASLMYLGHYEEARQLLEAAIPRAEGVGDLHTVCIALGFAALVYHGWHRAEQARAHHERALDIAERLGDPREISHRAVEASYHAFLVGDWEGSRRLAERALMSAMEQDNLRAFTQPLYTLGELALYTGQWDDADGYLRESMTIAQHLDLADYLRELQALLAERDVLEGNPANALSRLRGMVGSPGWDEHLSFLVALAATSVEAGDLDTAQDSIIKVVAQATQQRLPLVLADAHRVQGAIGRKRGDWENAQSHLERAVSLARDITYPWGEARALGECGQLYARLGRTAEAREHFQAAAAIFGRLGAEPYRLAVERRIVDLSRDAHVSSGDPTRPPSPH